MTNDTDRLIKIARDALIKLRPDASSVSSYGCVDKSGNIHCDRFTTNTMCHASAPVFVYNNEGVVFYTISTGLIGMSSVPPVIASRYFKWLCSADSPWADCLNNGLNNDEKFVAEYGLLITDLDKLGKNLVIGALAASRACFEHPQSVLMWDRLVQDGLEPRWAFFLCGFVTSMGPTIQYGMRGNQNHWPIHPWGASDQYIKNFLTQNVTFDEKAFSSKPDGTYGKGVGAVWGPYGEVKGPDHSSHYGVSVYWSDLKKKVGAVKTQEPGDFAPVERSQYKDFLIVAKQEQERLYA